jgi:hypothetical protein
MCTTIADYDQAGRIPKQGSNIMSDLRELTAGELNAATGGCRTVDTRLVDSIRAPIGPACVDTSTTNLGHQASPNLKLTLI